MQLELGSKVRMTILNVSQNTFQFAFLAMDALLGRPLTVPPRVEVGTPTIVGKFSSKKNPRELLRMSVAFGKDFQGE